jgi:hypothetical protein
MKHANGRIEEQDVLNLRYFQALCTDVTQKNLKHLLSPRSLIVHTEGYHIMDV